MPQTLKTLKLLKPSRSLAPLPPSPLAVSLCCSKVAACPLPAHSPLLLARSSLPFASLQTLKTLRWAFVCQRLQTLKSLKTLQIPRGSFHQALWPSAFAVPGLQPALCLHIALCCWGVQACRLPAFKPLKPSVGAFVCQASNT